MKSEKRGGDYVNMIAHVCMRGAGQSCLKVLLLLLQGTNALKKVTGAVSRGRPGRGQKL